MGDQPIAHEAFHTLVLSADSKETGVKLTAGEEHTELVLVRPHRVYALGFPVQFTDTVLVIDRWRALGPARSPIWSFRHDESTRDPTNSSGLYVYLSQRIASIP